MWEPSVVEASPHELVGLDDPPGCRQREGGGELSRRLRQNALCMVVVVVVVLVLVSEIQLQLQTEAATETRETHRRVADGDAVPVGSLHIDVVVADGHVAEGRASGALERREEHVPPVLGELSDHPIAAIADERQDVVHGEDGLLLRAYLPTGKAGRQAGKEIESAAGWMQNCSRAKGRQEETSIKQTSRRQSLSVSRRIHRVPGMGLVLTTRYLPLGFHTSMEMGFAMAAPAAACPDPEGGKGIGGLAFKQE